MVNITDIDVGQSADDGTGDPLREAFIKTNGNFDNISLEFQKKKDEYKLREQIAQDATLYLDFTENRYRIFEGVVSGNTSKPYQQLLSHTRASEARSVSPFGNLVGVLSGEQRLYFNPESLESEGLLIEERRKNLTLNSGDVTLYSTDTVTTGNTKNLIGLTFYECSSDGTTEWSQSATLETIGRNHVFSFYFEGLTGSQDVTLAYEGGTSSYSNSVTLNADLTLSNIPTDVNAYVIPYKNGAGRFVGVMDDNSTSADNTTATVSIPAVGWFTATQIEAGTVPTSYIPTASTAVLREDDDIRQTESTKWLNLDSFSLFSEFYFDSDVSSEFVNPNLISSTSASRVSLKWINNDLRFQVIDAGNVLLDQIVTGLVDKSFNKVAVSLKSDEYIAAINGTSFSFVGSGIPQDLDIKTLGGNDNARINNALKNDFVLPYNLTSNVIEMITTT